MYQKSMNKSNIRRPNADTICGTIIANKDHKYDTR